MSNSSKYKMSSLSGCKEPKGFMFVATGKITEKLAQDISKDKFEKASDNYLEISLEDSSFKIITLDDLQSLTEVDRNKYLLQTGKLILDQLSKLDEDVEFDYPGGY